MCPPLKTPSASLRWNSWGLSQAGPAPNVDFLALPWVNLASSKAVFSNFWPWKQCYNRLHARLHIMAKHHWNLKLNIFFVRRSLFVPLVLKSGSRQVPCRFRHHCFILLEKLQTPTALPGCYIHWYMATIAEWCSKPCLTWFLTIVELSYLLMDTSCSQYDRTIPPI